MAAANWLQQTAVNFYQGETKMSMTLISQALSQQNLRDVISLDQQGQLVVQDPNAAMNIMFNSDANSQVYKIVQLALQMQTLREQNVTRENQENFQRLISDGKVKVLQLEKALQESQNKIKNLETEIADSHTKEEIHQYELTLNNQARINGWVDIAAGIVLTPLVVTTILGLVTISKGIIVLNEKPVELQLMEDKIELYRAFYPEASLTDAFKYVQENPARFSKQAAEQFTSIEAYKEGNPEAGFEDFEKFILGKIYFRNLLKEHLGPERIRAPRF